ncbi:MAG TPA: hypothetical protein VK034_19130 [Enhygromyxa sp.]|nr:hypothetical protein [Enhygromyxa sp.]
MSEALLIEEAGDRAINRLHQLLTLVLLGFEDGEARARALAAAEPDRIIDPVASACFGEARELLTRAAGSRVQLRGGLFAAVCALDVAATREPDCYRLVHQAIRRLVLDALDDVVALELANAELGEAIVDELAVEPARN